MRGDRNMVSAENGRDFTWQKPSRIREPEAGLENKGTQAVIEAAVPVEIMRESVCRRDSEWNGAAGGICGRIDGA